MCSKRMETQDSDHGSILMYLLLELMGDHFHLKIYLILLPVFFHQKRSAIERSKWNFFAATFVCSICDHVDFVPPCCSPCTSCLLWFDSTQLSLALQPWSCPEPVLVQGFQTHDQHWEVAGMSAKHDLLSGCISHGAAWIHWIQRRQDLKLISFKLKF